MYFLIIDNNELQITRVSPEKEDEFHRRNDPKILMDGITVQDVLRKFDNLPLVINDGF